VTRSTCPPSPSLADTDGGGSSSDEVRGAGALPLFQVRHDDAFDQLEVMLEQERGPYRCRDYLSRARAAVAAASADDSTKEPSSRQAPQRRRRRSLVKIDPSSRAEMVEWCVRVSDFCDLDRPTVVAATFSILDRYLDTDEGCTSLYSRTSYRLSALTAFYIAIKTTQRMAAGPGVFVALSRGEYSEDDIIQTEREMLGALRWRVGSDLTAGEFLRRYFEILPDRSSSSLSSISISSLESGADQQEAASSPSPETKPLFDCAMAQAELAVGDYDQCVSVLPSVVAYASLLNAIFAEEGALPERGRRPPSFLRAVERVSRLIGSPSPAEVAEVRRRLWERAMDAAEAAADTCEGPAHLADDDAAVGEMAAAVPAVAPSTDTRGRFARKDCGSSEPPIEGLVVAVPTPMAKASVRGHCKQERRLSRQATAHRTRGVVA